MLTIYSSFEEYIDCSNYIMINDFVYTEKEYNNYSIGSEYENEESLLIDF